MFGADAGLAVAVPLGFLAAGASAGEASFRLRLEAILLSCKSNTKG